MKTQYVLAFSATLAVVYPALALASPGGSHHGNGITYEDVVKAPEQYAAPSDSSDSDIEKYSDMSACMGRFKKLTPQRLLRFCQPKTASYHRQKMGIHAKHMAIKAVAAPVSAATHVVAGTGGAVVSTLSAVGHTVNNEPLMAFGSLLCIPVRPVLGVISGAALGTANAIDATIQAAGVIYHGIQYPIAKCGEFICGHKPDHIRAKYNKKAKKYDRIQDKIECQSIDRNADIAAKLFGIKLDEFG